MHSSSSGKKVPLEHFEIHWDRKVEFLSWMSQGFLCYLCTIISLSYCSFIHLSKLLYTALCMALNMKEFLPTGRFLQESHFLKSFHGLPTQVLVLPIITKAFDWAESKCPGRPSWVINIPFSRQRISNSEMLPCPLLLQIHYLANIRFSAVCVTSLQQWTSGFVTALCHKVAKLMSSTHFLCAHTSMWPFFSQENLNGMPDGNPRLFHNHLASCAITHPDAPARAGWDV